MDGVSVTIILPVYNVSNYLERCLDSLLSQSYKHFEILCINDGSTDNSLEILRKYQSEHSIIRIVNQSNIGLGASRNVGLCLCKTPYVMFLDSDDYFESNLIEKLVFAAFQHDADIVCCNGFSLYENLGIEVNFDPIPTSFALENQPFSSRDLPSKIFQMSTPAVWTKLYKTDFLIRNAIFFNECKYAEDLVFFCKSFTLASKIVPIHDRLVHYRRRRANSITSLLTKEQALCVIYALREIDAFLVERNIISDLADSFIWCICGSIKYTMFLTQDFDSMQALYVESKQLLSRFDDSINESQIPHACREFASRILADTYEEFITWLLLSTHDQYENTNIRLINAQTMLRDEKRRSQQLVDELSKATEAYDKAKKENERLSEEKASISSSLFESRHEEENARNALMKCQNSKAFRIGNAMVFPYRSIRRFFRHVRSFLM